MSALKGKKTILITGCSSGIGHALAREFHSKGLYVIATARNKNSLADLEQMGMTTLSLEVTSSESIASARSEIEALTGGRLDILVNNAGRNCTIPGIECPLDEARATFEVNFFALMAVTQTFVPLLISSKGLIINIGSVVAIVPYVFGAVYNASKAAVHAWSSTLRLELEPYDVKVMVVVTGGVQSNIARTTRTLRENSLYLELTPEYERRLTHSQEGAMPSDEYARDVVKAALTRRPKWLWSGGKWFRVWFVWSFLGTWLFDLVIPRMFGLDRLKRLVLSREKRK